MKYIFKIEIYTDGDFGLPFIPCGMIYNESYTYSLNKEYDNRNEAIEDILNICTFLKSNMHTSRYYVKEKWDTSIDDFIKKIKSSEESLEEFVWGCMSGNSEASFAFYAQPQQMEFSFSVTDEEYELFENNKNRVTIGQIIEAVLDLFREKKDETKKEMIKDV